METGRFHIACYPHLHSREKRGRRTTLYQKAPVSETAVSETCVSRLAFLLLNSDPANKIKHFSRGDCALTAP